MIELHELRSIMRDAAEHALKQYRIQEGKEKAFISERKAFQKYGSTNVLDWKRKGLITRRKRSDKLNSTFMYDVAELDLLYRSNNY